MKVREMKVIWKDDYIRWIEKINWKKETFGFLLLFILALTFFPGARKIYAEDLYDEGDGTENITDEGEKQTLVSGKVRLFSSLSLLDNERAGIKIGDFIQTRGDLKLKVEGSISENISFYTRTDILWFDRSRISGIEDTEGFTWRGIIPIDVLPYYAYFEITEGIFDLSAGKKDVSWGMTDLSSISILTPPDLANFVAFDPDYAGKRIPVPFASAVLNLPYETDFISETSFGFYYLFSIKPAPLPEGFSTIFKENSRSAMMGIISAAQRSFIAGFPSMITNFGLPATYPVEQEMFRKSEISVSQNISLPRYSVDKAPFGLRFSTVLGGVDFLVSYERGYFPFPIATRVSNKVNLSWYIEGNNPAKVGVSQAEVETQFIYPEMKVIGGGFSTELGGFTLMGELGYFIPQKVDASIQSEVSVKGSVGGQKLTSADRKEESIPLFDDFVKASFGIERSFGVLDGLFINIQYARGFFDEIGYTSEAVEKLGIKKNVFMSPIQDYLILNVEQKFGREEFKVSLLSIFNVADFSEFMWSALFVPSFHIQRDGFELMFGYVRSAGDDGAKFGVFKDFSVFLINASVIF